MANFEKFKSTLIDKSIGNTFHEALDEWDFIAMSRDDDNCICGKKIVHTNTMYNMENGNEIIVGSTCVKKFMKDNERIMTAHQIMNYNENARQKGRLKRRCKTCSKVFTIHKIDDHNWKHQCTSCYKTKKPIKKKVLKVYNCHFCEEPFIDVEDLQCTIQHIGNVENKIYKCHNCRPKKNGYNYNCAVCEYPFYSEKEIEEINRRCISCF